MCTSFTNEFEYHESALQAIDHLGKMVRQIRRRGGKNSRKRITKHGTGLATVCLTNSCDRWRKSIFIITFGGAMLKVLLSLAVLSSASLYAQTPEEAENRLRSSLPDLRPVEEKEQYKIHMGLTAGVSSPNGDAESSPEVGLNIGFSPYIPFGLGAEITTAELDDTDTQRTQVLVRGSYNFGGDIPVLRHSYVGVGAGPMFVSDKVEWTIAPLAGFDIPLTAQTTDFLSLGLSARYLYTTETQDSFSGGLALKYWY